jgi:hypothetical protein
VKTSFSQDIQMQLLKLKLLCSTMWFSLSVLLPSVAQPTRRSSADTIGERGWGTASLIHSFKHIRTDPPTQNHSWDKGSHTQGFIQSRFDRIFSHFHSLRTHWVLPSRRNNSLGQLPFNLGIDAHLAIQIKHNGDNLKE